MRIAVAGGTGTAGQYAVEAARRAGHEVRSLSRREGVDVYTGDGLRDALAQVDVVIDALNSTSLRASAATDFFTITSRRLQEEGERQGVAHIVALSILGIDRVPGYGYYAAKLAQESAVGRGPLPVTVLRTTQFHEFPAQMLARLRLGPVAVVPHLRAQPVAARTVGDHLVSLADQRPGGIVELAGPDVHDIAALARRIAQRRGGPHVLAVSLPGRAGRAMRGGALLAGEQTVVDGPRFDDWLDSADARPALAAVR